MTSVTPRPRTHPVWGRGPIPSENASKLSHDEALQALCSQADPQAWHPEKGETGRTAKRICNRCPLRSIDRGGSGRCLAIALADPSIDGVWSGTTKRDRQKMRSVMEEASG
jgi:WhiB family redox-sensing transcriptional regulator